MKQTCARDETGLCHTNHQIWRLFRVKLTKPRLDSNVHDLTMYSFVGQKHIGYRNETVSNRLVVVSTILVFGVRKPITSSPDEMTQRVATLVSVVHLVPEYSHAPGAPQAEDPGMKTRSLQKVASANLT